MDNMYEKGISKEKAKDKWLAILDSNGIKPRSDDHTIKTYSYFVYNKEKYEDKKHKPLGLGIVYIKPDGTPTQDIFMIHPINGIEKYYKEYDMVSKYPSMDGVHKKDLPIN